MKKKKLKKVNKPKEAKLWDGDAKCITEVISCNEAFGVQIDAFIYDSKNVRKLIKFLIRAEKWMIRKEEHN